MKRHWQTNIAYGIVLFLMGVQPVFSQTEKKEEELKLNSEAIKLIQFNFNGQETLPEQELIEELQGRNWMKFKHDAYISLYKNDTTATGKKMRFIRMLPYSIWTKFGEDPVYDVIFSRERREIMTFVLDPFRRNSVNGSKWASAWPNDFYRRNEPNSANGSIGIETDFNKLYYENLTKRGRAIKHNRKHANAWKTYQAYLPTKADRKMYPTFYRSPETMSDSVSADTTFLPTDSIHSAETPFLLSAFPAYPILPIYTNPTDSLNVAPRDSLHKDQKKDEKKGRSLSLYEYIRQQQALDSIQKQKMRTKKRFKRENAYEIEQQKRFLKEQRN